MQFLPDWSIAGNPSELEESIGNGFKFKGPGLYLTETESSLVIPRNRIAESTWRSDTDSTNEIFTFYHFNCPIQDTVLGSSIPVRTDTRSDP